jgi:hypothetical protein
MSARRKDATLARALASAALLAALAPRAAAQSDVEPPPPRRSCTTWHGWLSETLDGNVDAAIEHYEQAARDPGLTQTERNRAATRLGELARQRGDAAAQRRYAELLGSAAPATLAPPASPAEALRDASAAGDAERVEQLRRAFLDELQKDPGLAAWSGPPASPKTQPEPEIGPSFEALRLHLPLPDTATPGDPLRERAAQITELRLGEQPDRADRLERDLLSRLARSGRLDVLAKDTPFATLSPSQLEAARERLARAAASDRLTSAETRILQSALARLDELLQAGAHEDATRFLRRVPYAVAADDRPARG